MVEIEQLFGGAFKGKKVLVTGDTGFKGSWLSIWLTQLGARVYGYALPPKTTQDNFVRCRLSEKITHHDGDVVDHDSFFGFVKEVQPEIAFHLAAQPLVIYSYENPRETYATNLMGTVNFFEVVRNTPSIKIAVNVTSDKCYDNLNWVWGYRETDAMGGKDPYSSSKGCSELITSAYLHSYFSGNSNGKRIASARAGNVIGGGDWAENRIVPDFFRALRTGEVLTMRNPGHTRPWQYVLEPLSGYLQLAAALLESESYAGGWNFGPSDSNHYSVEHLVKQLISICGKGSFKIPSGEEARYEAHLLKLDVSKASKFLGWKPALDFDQTVCFTAKGYLDEEDSSRDVFEKRILQIKEYANQAQAQKIRWTT